MLQCIKYWFVWSILLYKRFHIQWNPQFSFPAFSEYFSGPIWINITLHYFPIFSKFLFFKKTHIQYKKFSTSQNSYHDLAWLWSKGHVFSLLQTVTDWFDITDFVIVFICIESFLNYKHKEIILLYHHHHHLQNSPFLAIAILRRFCQICPFLGIRPSSFLFIGFPKNIFFYRARLSTLYQTPNLEDQISVCMCLSGRVAQLYTHTGFSFHHLQFTGL
jgi:hypothetical protein